MRKGVANGNSFSYYNDLVRYINMAIMIIPIISTQIPARNISLAFTFPVANTMVLGAVAIGKTNPKDAAKVAGIINTNGSKFISLLNAAKTGNIN